VSAGKGPRRIRTFGIVVSLCVAVMVVSVGSALGEPHHRGRAVAPAASATPDFNGDGYADMVVAAPFDDAGGVTDSGAINVLYGTASGLSATGGQYWSQAGPDVLGDPATEETWGRSFGIGDFNGDGYTDLAVGDPYETVGSVTQAGAVNVLYGSPIGLTAQGNQYWTQDTPGVPGTAHSYDFFGHTLVGGDFNGDGFGDLAIGVTGDHLSTCGDCGSVNILYGGADGLSATGSQLWALDTPGVPGGGGSRDGFGHSLASSDLNGDGFADLAVGAPANDVGSTYAGYRAGTATVLYGSSVGLTAVGSQLWTEASPGVPDAPETQDYFASALATGDFNGDGFGDLAIGVDNESVGSVAGAGAVILVYGSSAGLSASGSQFWNQDSAGVAGTAQQNDRFGSALAAANFGNGPQADLAVGVIEEPHTGLVSGAGTVNVLYGSPSGLTATGNQYWWQDSPGVADTAEFADHFGSALAAGSFGNGSQADLAIGVPSEDVGSVKDAGAVNVLYGSSSGLTATGNQFWTQDSTGVAGTAEAQDLFGLAVGAG